MNEAILKYQRAKTRQDWPAALKALDEVILLCDNESFIILLAEPRADIEARCGGVWGRWKVALFGVKVPGVRGQL